MTDISYACVNPDDVACAESCFSLEDCQSCNCAVVDLAEQGGPWGDFMDVFFCLLPIIVLVLTVTVPSMTLPTTKSLPLAAFLMFLVRLAYLGSDPLLVTSAVVRGLLEAFTPLSIMAGAICLFETMEATLCLPFMMREIEALTAGHPIAELMLIFAFAYMVEGASGFGTPAALSAPMLVRRGYSAKESVVVVLIFNTFATVWGAVGTPLWFGFSNASDNKADLDDTLLEISYRAALALAVSGAILMPFILTILVSWKTVQSNLIFLYLSFFATVGPSVAIAFVNYEFPSLLGGMVGCLISAVLIKLKIGLNPVDHEHETDDCDTDNHSAEIVFDDEAPKTKDIASADEDEEAELEEVQMAEDRSAVDKTAAEPQKSLQTEESESPEVRLGPRKSFSEGYLQEVAMRTFPLWGVVFLLILTRVEQIGIKEHLTARDSYFSIHFGSLGTFRLSSSIVFELRDIMSYPNMSWKYELLYIPFLLPFVFVSVLTMILFRHDLDRSPSQIFGTVTARLTNAAIALMGALPLVQLVIRTGALSPAYILGTVLADWFKEAFVIICPVLGALGSFFSGSTTVSNLTFGEIQKIAAEAIGTSSSTMLALQAVGGSAGNGICLNNIIAACAVVGLNIGEGQILMATYKFVFANTTIATVVMLILFFRF